ncbi:hypothetical protein AVEN_52171-1 [Araneus ventricosus]|uniref:Uncharacterized protein n=1 Tax=Araneus ventricosus TaxID=182803 RepID=A0A4Y2JM71_ARAVE|nr:hypothetical protein AVEN_52171-1 [Araneus ventricosus]
MLISKLSIGINTLFSVIWKVFNIATFILYYLWIDLRNFQLWNYPHVSLTGTDKYDIKWSMPQSVLTLRLIEQYQSDKPLLPYFASDVLILVNDCIQHFKILKPENERIEKPETLCKFNFSDPNLYNDKS